MTPSARGTKDGGSPVRPTIVDRNVPRRCCVPKVRDTPGPASTFRKVSSASTIASRLSRRPVRIRASAKTAAAVCDIRAKPGLETSALEANSLICARSCSVDRLRGETKRSRERTRGGSAWARAPLMPTALSRTGKRPRRSSSFPRRTRSSPSQIGRAHV